jgi:hypothetical protein
VLCGKKKIGLIFHKGGHTVTGPSYAHDMKAANKKYLRKEHKKFYTLQINEIYA